MENEDTVQPPSQEVQCLIRVRAYLKDVLRQGVEPGDKRTGEMYSDVEKTLLLTL